MYRNFKYLIAYLAPLSAVLAIYAGGFWSFSAIYLAFMIIPFMELFLPTSVVNHVPEEEDSRLSQSGFGLMLYLNLPLLYFIMGYFVYKISSTDLQIFEQIGMTLSVGIVCGALGINVAHELGHRETWWEQLMSKMMLLTCHYMHFFIEHNRGHHKNVSTDEDPASSRLNESLYAFFVRSVRDSYLDAWKLEAERLRREAKPALSIANEMIWYQIIQVAYIAFIGIFFGIQTMFLVIIAGIIGFLLLETINYIEHYGLRRQKMPSGRYEKVMPYHSWNSDHELGRIFLYELTRHSDHHYKATRKYQILRHFDESPQLPLGYPGSMLLAFIPSLWFKKMNPEVARFNNLQRAAE